MLQKLVPETCTKNLTQVHHSFLHQNNSPANHVAWFVSCAAQFLWCNRAVFYSVQETCTRNNSYQIDRHTYQFLEQVSLAVSVDGFGYRYMLTTRPWCDERTYVLNGCICYCELLGAVSMGISCVLVMNLMQTVDVCTCHIAILFMQTHFVTGFTCRTCSCVTCQHRIPPCTVCVACRQYIVMLWRHAESRTAICYWVKSSIRAMSFSKSFNGNSSRHSCQSVSQSVSGACPAYCTAYSLKLL